MTTVIGVSGKKQAGKDTLVSGLVPLLEKKGTVKVYTFADSIKKFCIDVLGLRKEQVWGTDEQKNTPTEYCWENLPGYIRWDFGGRWKNHGGLEIKVTTKGGSEEIYNSLLRYGSHPIRLMNGNMSARHVMQVVGTEVFREMFSKDIWVNDLFRRVKNEKPDFAMIPDLRFPSEIKAVNSRDGLVIRLLRNIMKGDCHGSEIALDGWLWEKYDNALVVPEDATIVECRKKSYHWILKKMKERQL